MRTLFANTLCAIASLGVTAGLVAFADPAIAATRDDAPRQIVVPIGDLDLHAPAGHAAAARRIRHAAGAVCTTADVRVSIDDRCRDKAIAAAVRTLDARVAAVAGATQIASR